MLISSQSPRLPVCFCVLFLFSSCDKIPKPSQFQEKAVDPVPEITEAPLPMPPKPVEAPVVMITPEELLQQFQALKSYEIDDKTLIEIAKNPVAQSSVTTLDLSSSQVTDQGVSAVIQLANLEELNLTKTRVRGECLPELKSLEHLKVLNLEATQFDSPSVQAIGELSSLRELSLKATGVNDNFYEHLANLGQLEVLHLDSNINLIGRNFADLVARKKFPELKVLTASGTKFGLYGLLSVDRLEKLEELHIQNAELNLKAIIPISNCNNMKVLNLSGNPLNNAALAPLKRLKKLEELNLGQCTGVTDPAVDILKTMSHLKKLTLTGTSLTPQALQKLQMVLKETEVVL